MPLHKWTRWLIYTLPFVFFYYCYLPQQSLPAEDASILYAYAQNFIESGRLSYYPNGNIVFATADILYLILVSTLMFLGIPAYAGSMIISALSALVCIFVLLSLVKNDNKYVELLIVGLFFSFYQHFAGASGYSTLAFAATLLIAVYFFDRQRYLYMAIFCFATVFMRLEGMIYAIILLLISFIELLRKNESRVAYKMVGIFSILMVIYLVSLNTYFGNTLPLPFYVKSHGNHKIASVLYQSSIYLNYHYLKFFLSPLLICTLLIIVLKRTFFNRLILVAIGLGLINLLFYSLFKQEMNLFYRYQFPFTIMIMIVWIRSYNNISKDLYFKILTLMLIIVNLTHLSKGIEASLSRQYSNFYQIGNGLSELKDGKLATTESGIIPWLSKWETVDLWGLNTPEFSEALPKIETIKNGAFDLVIMHAQHENYGKVFRNNTVQIIEVKTWENMCVVISRACSENFELIMIPSDVRRYDISNKEANSSFLKRFINVPVASRYDAFFVNANSSMFQEIVSLLNEYGGIDYEEYLNK